MRQASSVEVRAPSVEAPKRQASSAEASSVEVRAPSVEARAPSVEASTHRASSAEASRRNCKGNPNCLVGIGEHTWLGEIDENTFHNIDDPNSERRDKNTFVGLTNLGATCYVNTFLQVWFHNLELRQTLYLCQNSRAEEHDAEDDTDEKCVYELSAVLIHRGVSAYSGHYIAHVRDARTKDWYKFNDEEIEKMEGKKLQLGIEEDIAEPSKSQTRKPKCSKGFHCSRNSYMLVYKQQVDKEVEKSQSEINVQVPDGDSLSLKEHLIDELDYILVPTEGWNKLVSWYGLTENQEPVARKQPIGPGEELLVWYNGEHNTEIAAAIEEERASSFIKTLPRAKKGKQPIGPGEELLVWYNGEHNTEIAAAIEEERASSFIKTLPRAKKAYSVWCASYAQAGSPDFKGR
ncbi:UNVERIFIED_CONTAM: hypothetical protein FKN15_055223 [Acipenser sinensis]